MSAEPIFAPRSGGPVVREPLPLLSEAECCGERCRYNPDTIRRVRSKLRRGTVERGNERNDFCGIDELDSVMDPFGGYDRERTSVQGPSAAAKWSVMAHEIREAQRQGARTNEEIAARLCPWALRPEDDDDVLEAA